MTQINDPKLKPCPFCGEAAHYGLESIEAKIIETERLIEEIEQKLKRLQEIKRRTQKALGETEATSTDASL